MSHSDHPRPLQGKAGLELRCARCGHDLRSLSINAACPTCTLPVRSSIRVDFAEREVPTVCGSCGYDLRGLAGDRCPECGTALTECAVRPGPLWEKAIQWIDAVDPSCPACGGSVQEGRCVVCGLVVARGPVERPSSPMRADARRVLESFDAEPLPLVRAVRRRALLAALLVVVPIAASLAVSIAFAGSVAGGGGRLLGPLLGVISILAGPMAPLTQPAFAATTVVSVVIPLGILLLTQPVRGALTASPKLGDGARSRKVARWASFAWWLVPGFSGTIALTGNTALLWPFIAAMSLALLSLAPINLHLRNLAAWLVDEKADHFFNVGVWGALLAPLVPIGLLTRGGGMFLTAVCGLAAAAAYYGTAAGLVSLAWSACWSVTHAERRLERDARRMEKARQRFAEVADQVGRTDPTPERGRQQARGTSRR